MSDQNARVKSSSDHEWGMNDDICANCLVHGWKQSDLEISLQTCKNCELIKYCSIECQDEHWAKVHKHHCQYFADPAKNEAWQHKETDCSLCLKAAQVGESNFKEADNPNYECIFKVEIPPSVLHPHPFPVTGQPGNIYEKGIIVLWQLVRKFQIIQPDIARNCQDEFLELETTLIQERVRIWSDMKFFSHPEALEMGTSRIEQNLNDLQDNMERKATLVQDTFHLWNIVLLIKGIVYNVELINLLKFLKDPLTDLPEDIKKLLSEGINIEKTTKYLALAGKVLETLRTQVIPHKDVLKIVCDGNLEQKCCICSEEVAITSDVAVFFDLLHQGKFFCGSQDCQEKRDATVGIMWKRNPIKWRGSDMHDIHRCRHCKTTMYCSRDCLYQDDQVHEKACKKDKEGRKKKLGGSRRRKAASEQIERLETEDPIVLEVLEKFKGKKSFKQK